MMDRPGMIAEHWRQGRWFIVALLLALASALVPALLASGPPSSRSTGSAFDPATNVVALRSRAQAIVQAEAILDQNNAGKILPERSQLPLAFAAPAPRAENRAGLAYPQAEALPPPTPRAQARRLTRAQPRAPPLRTA